MTCHMLAFFRKVLINFFYGSLEICTAVFFLFIFNKDLRILKLDISIVFFIETRRMFCGAGPIIAQ